MTFTFHSYLTLHKMYEQTKKKRILYDLFRTWLCIIIQKKMIMSWNFYINRK